MPVPETLSSWFILIAQLLGYYWIARNIVWVTFEAVCFGCSLSWFYYQFRDIQFCADNPGSTFYVFILHLPIKYSLSRIFGESYYTTKVTKEGKTWIPPFGTYPREQEKSPDDNEPSGLK